jgi:ribosomal protein S18 acetylase RimI-like enzyme
MKIREFQSRDYDQVLALWEAGGLVISRSDSPEALEKQLECDADLFLVAEENSSVFGVVLGRWEGRRGWINRLAVDPTQRHKRLGSLLVTEVEKRLKVKGCEKVNLLIDPDNSGVQVFYEQLGYSRDDLIFMEKWLVE